MRIGDRLLQQWRIRMAEPYVHDGDALLDIGTFNGAMLERVRSRISRGVGIDPLIEARVDGTITILHGTVPDETRIETGAFDCITMLATLEHVRNPNEIARECFRALRPGGRLVVTVPHALVDHIVAALVWIGIADGMDLDAHHGFDVGETVPLFTGAGFRLVAQRSFELWLNRLYVFERLATA